MAIGPLSGVKVLEYSSFVAGPFCAKMLADLGAEVIKIEKPDGDEARRRGPYKDGQPGLERSSLFLYHNTNKMGITLDPESREGRDIFLKLVSQADILIDDRLPRDAERSGLHYEALKKINPGLIMASITPFGQAGPYRDYKAYYLNTYHASGAGYVLPANSPNADREPLKGGGYVGECDVGSCALISILGALFWRAAGGTGQFIDISKQEAMMSLERMNLVRYYELGTSPTRVKINRLRDTLLRCRDGGYIKIVLHPDNMWKGVVKALGSPDWTGEEQFSNHKVREANFDELTARLQEEADKYETYELFYKIQAFGTACAPICSAEQVYNSPQTAAREFYVEIGHPVAGRMMYPGLPYKLSDGMPQNNQGAPLLGEHNEEIYCGRLGYSKQQLGNLRESGVI